MHIMFGGTSSQHLFDNPEDDLDDGDMYEYDHPQVDPDCDDIIDMGNYYGYPHPHTYSGLSAQHNYDMPESSLGQQPLYGNIYYEGHILPQQSYNPYIQQF